MKTLNQKNETRIAAAVNQQLSRDQFSGLAGQVDFWKSGHPLAGKLTLSAIVHHLREEKNRV